MGVGLLAAPPRWKPRWGLRFAVMPLVALERVLMEGDVDASASRPSSCNKEINNFHVPNNT